MAGSFALAFLCLLLALGHSLYVGLPYLIHYYDNLARDNPRRPSLRGYLRAYLVEWFFTLATQLSYPFGILGDGVSGGYDPKGGPPIVMVHGFMMNRSSFFAMYWRLRRHGYRNLYPINLRPLLAPIAAQARTLERLLAMVSASADGKKVVAIGHSQGGIVLRYLTTTSGPSNLEKLVTLGSPHQGTRMAHFGYGPNARELRPGSALLSELGSRVPTVSIWSDLDQIITPAESARLEANRFFAETGHHALLYSSEVFSAILEELPPWQLTDPVVNQEP